MIRLLLADAQNIERTRIKQLCQEMGDFAVTLEAGSVEEVLGALEATNFDMVIIEPDMPGDECPNGGEDAAIRLIQMIRSRHANLPILAFSVHTDPKIARRMLNEGASGYLSKDCVTETLSMAMRKVAAGGRFISHEIAIKMIFEREVERPPVVRERITRRELQIMQMFCRGMTIQEISVTLGINSRTVSTHKTRLMRKMNFKNNVELYRYAVESGIVNPGL